MVNLIPEARELAAALDRPLYVEAAHAAATIVAGDASVAGKFGSGSSSGSPIGGGGRFTVADLGQRWEVLADRIHGWLRAQAAELGDG